MHQCLGKEIKFTDVWQGFGRGDGGATGEGDVCVECR
jgi:hypothetical protein